MSKIDVKLFDVVRLKDKREGTIVEVYDDPPGFECEISGTEPELVTIATDQVEEVIWNAP